MTCPISCCAGPFNFEEEDEGQWFEIPSKVVDFENEDAIYNDSNTTQREITAFEIIDNAIDEMKKNGVWEETVEKIKIDRINSMTDRALRDNVKNLVSDGVLNVDTSKHKAVQKELLYKVDSKYIPGIDGPLNEAIAKYVFENKQRKVSVASVNNTRKMLSMFSEPLIKCIYDGQISARDAQGLMSVYDSIDVGKVVEDIRGGNFDISSLKKERRTKVRYSERQILDLLYDIKNGSKTVDEVINLIEQK